MSVFYATPDAGVSTDIKAFFEAIKGFIPNGINIQCPSEGERINEVNGQLQSVWTGGVGGQVICNGAQANAAGVGAVVTWKTGSVVNGNRVTGRTFLVPLFTTAYATDGTLVETTRSAIQTAVDNLVTAAAGDLLIWHRPVGGAGGSAHAVVSGRVSDTVATLRTRRR